MANLKVYLTAKTKQFRKGMRRADRSVRRLSRNVKRYGVMAGAAFGAVAVKSVQAAMEQEDAERKLAAALRTNGDAVDRLMPKFKNLAAAMQQETVFGDELLLSQMAQIRNLGIMPNQMEQATKGAIGLSAALGLNSESAARYTALAMQGEYTILQRYVPALRAATTEAEKQAIVTSLMARGYKQAKEQAQTAGGQFKQFKNDVGDLMEVFGGLVMEIISFDRNTAEAKSVVKDFASDLKTRMPEIAYTVRVAFTEIKYAFLQVWEVGKRVWSNLSKFIGASMHNIVETFKVVKSHAKALWNNFSVYAKVYMKVVVDSLLSRFESLFSHIVKGFKDVWGNILKGDFEEAGKAWASTIGSAIKDQVKITTDAPKQLADALEKEGIETYRPEFKDVLKDQKGVFDAVDSLEKDRLAERAKLLKAYEMNVAKEVSAAKEGQQKKRLEKEKKASEAAAAMRQSDKFAAAMTRGSQGAYSLSLRQRSVDMSQEKTAEHTESISKKMTRLITATEANSGMIGTIA